MYPYAANNPVRYIDPDGRENTQYDTFISLFCEFVNFRNDFDNSPGKLKKDYRSYFTMYCIETTDKFLSKITNPLKAISHLSSMGGVFTKRSFLGMVGTACNWVAHEWDKRGSNYIAQDFCSFYYSAIKEVERLENYANFFSSSIPEFSDFLNEQIKYIQDDINANKVYYYSEYTKQQTKFDSSPFSNVYTIKQFQNTYPSYYNTCEEMLKEAENDSKIIEGLPLEFYYNKYYHGQ